jgi:probable rRNA maturation factor
LKHSLEIQNQQRIKRINLRQLDKILRTSAQIIFRGRNYDLGFSLVGTTTMTELNEQFLAHAGCTDVITFDYGTPATDMIQGEVVVCVPEAIRQAKAFGQDWPQELLRYLVHGMLHLRGFDDKTPAGRKGMRREEDRALLALSKEYDLRRIAASKRQRGRRPTRV